MKDRYADVPASYGISQADFISLARIWNRVQPHGIEAKYILPLSGKDQKLGIEILFQRGKAALLR